MTYSFAPNGQPLYVAEGEFLQFRFKAPNTWDTTRTVTIRIGDLDQFWLLTTIPEDFTPDPFPFTDISADPGAELSTLFTTDVVFNPPDGAPTTSLTGLTPGTQASLFLGCNVSGNENIYAMRIDPLGDGNFGPWIQGDGTQVVENGAKIQVRARSSEFIVSPTRLTLVIGTSNEVWTIFTRAGVINEPNPFPDFTDLDEQDSNTYCYTPEVIRLQGMIDDADISLSAPGEWAVSSTGNTTTDVNGFQILDGATFTNIPGTVANGDYLQLRMLSSSNPITPLTTNLTIGTEVNGSDWTVRTGNNPSENPNSFSFPDIVGAIEDTLIGSEIRPDTVDGITGLGNGISVPVTVVSTDASLVRIKKNNGSVGVFPTTVENGDKIRIYLQSSATFGDTKSLQIKVGDRTISTWQVQTSAGPDTDADWSPPPNKNNQIPSSFVSSNPIAVTGINRPITIQSVAGYNALISIDYDTPVLGPRTFDPLVNSTFYVVVQAADQLGTPEVTTIQLGTGNPNQFQWQVTTYVTVPPSAANVGVWYSKKNSSFDTEGWIAAGSIPENAGDYYTEPKLDGYSIGTVLPILKEGVDNYGDLDGDLSSRYPGFIKCEGQSLDTTQYFMLFDIIGYSYGGSGSNFNLPDYRNRRICGIGPVDNQRGNSAALPTTTGGIDVPGSEGGFWYFNKIGSRGSQPLDQVQGIDSGLTPGSLDSDYFSLGTVRLSGLSTITEIIPFEINPNGFVTAQIGPLQSVKVGVPAHSHMYISAVTEGDRGDPLNRWGGTSRGLMGTNAQASYYETGDNSVSNSEEIWQEWVDWLGTLRNFKQEIIKYLGSEEAFETWVRANFPANDPVNEEPPSFDIDFSPLESSDFGDTSDDEEFDIEFLTWWLSPISGLSGATLVETGIAPRTQGSSRNWGCVFDTQPATFRIDNYLSTASGTETLTHSHLITENPVTNIQADFTGGNENDQGQNSGGFGSGLGGGVAGSVLTFKMRWSGTYVDSNGDKDPDGSDGGGGNGTYFPATAGDWGYRNGGAGYWTLPTDEVTREEDMITTGSSSGSGLRMEITYQAWPTGGDGSSNNDTRIRVNRIISAGSGYAVGDLVTTAFWNDDIPGTAARMLEIAAVGDAGTGGAAAVINVNFTQSDIFMDLSEGLFKYSSAFKRPFPDVIMRPQRQVPILTPFHKSKYIIKAY
ncbi:short tail fiber protein [Synechococcus phage ACG-2014i]|uniref:Phage tail collar domain-containing protein n=1 Tax=Synechococcus phage ACG-2014i TaxID=1493513 RepID=A0A0E3FH59_9CAUD|nr:short tail fiber protein [Synechococcus phage ACG-2014i]AIX26755.1 hypothetical protein Syn7803US120_34 [Synechococcus phage ACG-2014i]